MIGGKIENGLERGFVKHCLNYMYLLITDSYCFNNLHKLTVYNWALACMANEILSEKICPGMMSNHYRHFCHGLRAGNFFFFSAHLHVDIISYDFCEDVLRL